jgi:ABC-type antimicrobial peptide transport system permease subunit
LYSRVFTIAAIMGPMVADLRWWAELLDSKFRVPGTNIRFGIDPILSLMPGFGEMVTPLFTMVLFAQALRLGVPKVVLVRMAINALLDAAIGALPFIGEVADMFWRANVTNLALLERHAQPGVRPTSGDFAFVWGITAVMGLLVAVPVILGVLIAMTIWTWLIS